MITVIVCIGTVMINVLILTLIIKLYTEIVKLQVFTSKKKSDVK